MKRENVKSKPFNQILFFSCFLDKISWCSQKWIGSMSKSFENYKLSYFDKEKEKLLSDQTALFTLLKIYWIFFLLIWSHRLANVLIIVYVYFDFSLQFSRRIVTLKKTELFKFIFQLEMGQIILHTKSFPLHFVNFVCIMATNKLLPNVSTDFYYFFLCVYSFNSVAHQ